MPDALNSTRDDRKSLAREVIVTSGAWSITRRMIESMSTSVDIEPADIFGDLDSFKNLWLDHMSDAWADIFTAEHLRALSTWYASPVATEMLEKQATLQTIGEAVMEKVIELNTQSVS